MSIANNLSSGIRKVTKTLNEAGTKIVSASSSVKKDIAKTAHKFYLAIPKDADPGSFSYLNDFIKSANELGESSQSSEKKALKIVRDTTNLSNNLLTLTDKGIALSASHVDKLLQRISKNSPSSGDVRGRINQAGALISSVNSVLDTALAGVELDALIKDKNADSLAIAQGALDTVSNTFSLASSSVGSIEGFSKSLASLGSKLQNVKGLERFSSLLSNTPNLNFGTVTTVLDGAAGVFQGVKAGVVLGSDKASTNEKIAAGFEMANQIVGNVAKVTSKIILAQRVAAGLSITGPMVGLVVSSVSLLISPLAFLAIGKKFEYANELQKLADIYKKHGYDGDEFLTNFHKETGAADAAITTITTALNGVSTGVSIAATASAVGAPVALIVGAIAGIVTGILDAVKQPIFESIANKFQQKILDWEKNNPGQNFFDNGYASRYAELLKDNLEALKTLATHFDSVVAVTQQGWDKQIGELAAVTKLGEKITSGKIFSDVISVEGVLKDSKEVLIDPQQGSIVLNGDKKSQALTFLTPLMSATSESRVRQQTGKNSYLTELQLGKITGWSITDRGNTNTTVDFTHVVQRFIFENGNKHDIKLIADLGKGDDIAYISSGSTEINGGEGFDIVNYTKSQGNFVKFDAINGVSGNYNVSRHVSGTVYQEGIKSQKSNAGKRSEEIQYRDVTLKGDIYNVTDKLLSVEQIIGSSWINIFNGGEQTDRYFGGNGHDEVHGNGGNDILAGGGGDDRILGGAGNDFIWGGKGNDFLSGGSGNDTFFFYKGEGNDVISDSSGNNDLLILKNINANELSFRRNNLNLEMTIRNSNDSITFSHWYFQEDAKERHSNYKITDKTEHKIEAIYTADGKTITSDKIDALISAMSSFDVASVSGEPGKIFDDVLAQKLAVSSIF